MGFVFSLLFLFRVVSYLCPHWCHVPGLCLCAAQLSLLLYVRVFSNSSLHLRVCHVSFVHQETDGESWGHSLESDERISCICDTNGLLLHLAVVCWWTYWLSFIPYRHKPGQLSYSFCKFVLLAWYFVSNSSSMWGLALYMNGIATTRFSAKSFSMYVFTS